MTIGDSVTTIGNDAFYACNNLTSITIGSGVTSIGYDAFRYCYKLVEVINKSGLNITKGSSGYGYIGEYVLIVHNGESKIVNQDGYLFITYEETNYLLGYTGTGTVLTLPNDYNGGNYQIYESAFEGCSGLTSVTIGNGVTEIGSCAFSSCWGLTSVTIGNSVTSIGESAFYHCSGLTSVYYQGTESDWKKISIGSSNSNLTSATRYYYSETKPTAEGNYWHYVNGEVAEW